MATVIRSSVIGASIEYQIILPHQHFQFFLSLIFFLFFFGQSDRGRLFPSFIYRYKFGVDVDICRWNESIDFFLIGLTMMICKRETQTSLNWQCTTTWYTRTSRSLYDVVWCGPGYEIMCSDRVHYIAISFLFILRNSFFMLGSYIDLVLYEKQNLLEVYVMLVERWAIVM